MGEERTLTKQRFWEDYWGNKLGGKSIRKPSLLMQELFRKFDEYLPHDSSKTAIEIGGAPGEYLLYMSKRFGYIVSSMDYSKLGNEKTKETFLQDGTSITIYEEDLFAPIKNIPQFDIVYSLGFIEHFDNPEICVAKHVDLLKPGGILLIGAPNLTGIYHWFLKYLSPTHDKTHNLRIMDIENWESFEINCHLTPIFKGYIGGFEPLVMKKLDVHSSFNHILYFIVKFLMIIFSFKLRFLRRLNSKYWSAYLIGIYRKTI